MKALLILILLAGCTSLHHEVFSKLQIGDDQVKVNKALGEPDSMKSDTNSKWVYTRRSERCTFDFNGPLVSAINCDSNPGYVSPLGFIGSALAAGGRAVTEGSRNRQQPIPLVASPSHVNCQSYRTGNQVTTNCY